MVSAAKSFSACDHVASSANRAPSASSLATTRRAEYSGTIRGT